MLRLPGEYMAPGCTMGRRQAGGGSVMLWAMFCWETLDPAIQVDVNLTGTTYLSIVADHVHSFMETVFPDGCGLFQSGNAQCHKAKTVQEWFEEHNNEFELLTWPPNSGFHSNRASVECAGQISPNRVGSTLLLTGFKGTAVLVSDTTAHLQGSSGVHASMDSDCFGRKGGPTQN